MVSFRSPWLRGRFCGKKYGNIVSIYVNEESVDAILYILTKYTPVWICGIRSKESKTLFLNFNWYAERHESITLAAWNVNQNTLNKTTSEISKRYINTYKELMRFIHMDTFIWIPPIYGWPCIHHVRTFINTWWLYTEWFVYPIQWKYTEI